MDETVKKLVAACLRLKCSVITRTKALLIYHHFKRCIPDVEYDCYLVAAACLSLSIKFNEEPVDLDTVILVFISIVKEESHKCYEDKKQLRRSLTYMENAILRITEFCLNYVLAHDYITYFLNDIREEITAINLWDVCIETTMRLANDFYLSDKCLNYKPAEIAAIVIYVSLYLLGFDINSEECYLKTWLKTLNKYSETFKYEIVEDLFRICDMGSDYESKQREISSSMNNIV